MSLQNFWRAIVEMQTELAEIKTRLDTIEQSRKGGRPKKEASNSELQARAAAISAEAEAAADSIARSLRA